MKIELYCCLCAEKYEEEIDIPGWKERYDSITSEKGFCPDHAIIAEFSDKQCPGCVGGWMECNLWSSFAYSNRRTITEKDLQMIEKGVCPGRVNGTFSVNVPGSTITDVDISERADSKSGKALAEAIREYCEMYPAT